ncbi:hypothetical protein TPE_0192 [Treponema pedis str. T A4]|uniref:AAA domain-containing protein n=1 Tax=Treponema pedis str. T A4 TaxID=1291379 RepID=S5ZXG1_9SPIR|nr:hypothetical protein TPE_0192 [Treponema pedis str. T A4]
MFWFKSIESNAYKLNLKLSEINVVIGANGLGKTNLILFLNCLII